MRLWVKIQGMEIQRKDISRAKKNQIRATILFEKWSF